MRTDETRRQAEVRDNQPHHRPQQAVGRAEGHDHQVPQIGYKIRRNALLPRFCPAAETASVHPKSGSVPRKLPAPEVRPATNNLNTHKAISGLPEKISPFGREGSAPSTPAANRGSRDYQRRVGASFRFEDTAIVCLSLQAEAMSLSQKCQARGLCWSRARNSPHYPDPSARYALVQGEAACSQAVRPALMVGHTFLFLGMRGCLHRTVGDLRPGGVLGTSVCQVDVC